MVLRGAARAPTITAMRAFLHEMTDRVMFRLWE